MSKPKEGKVEALVAALREQIKKNAFGRGRLPSFTEIGKRYDVGRATVFQALQQLQAEGCVVSKGKSFYANPLLFVSTVPTPSFEELLREQGMEPIVRNIIEPEVIVMPDELATLFGLAHGLRVVHRYRVQGSVDVAYRLSEYWYPASFAEKYLSQMKEDPGFDTLAAIKEEMGISRQIVHDDLVARIPTKEEAAYLSISRMTPVLEIRRTNKSTDEMVLMLHRIVLVGPFSVVRYQYEL
ncbi:DNA-binding GntR family transcriptional regulator [Thermosporothrix hazakensis]|jgi:DNA-binding GntR family transcriptional regulator|uniref:DNA-binding GntR family transcriptional regulator n=1 Tax=Thermosporothrix hazakensis TaxID=644383 RepID=A0A326TQD0_THEHA|nr:GntR family transcriptional regulator [Thermosporothrix hazakensis]PZW18066.1 DNA-binding GntR family transcriptional regulator [Thermosporothrix hazakensis]GCE50637.1 hypothetical protein KTH_55060 [Thermosporothrix hazakensis]